MMDSYRETGAASRQEADSSCQIAEAGPRAALGLTLRDHAEQRGLGARYDDAVTLLSSRGIREVMARRANVHGVFRRDDVEDLIQDTTIRILRYPGSADARRGVVRGIYRAVRQSAIDRWRVRACRPAEALTAFRYDEEGEDVVGVLLGCHDKQLENIPHSVDVQAALQKLSPTHRKVVELFYFKDMTHEQISKIMGTPIGTTKSRLHHAHRVLRGILGDYEAA